MLIGLMINNAALDAQLCTVMLAMLIRCGAGVWPSIWV
jgi:hypothetical protein